MKIEHPLAVRAIGVTGSWLVRRVVGTCRFHFRYADPTVDPAVARRTGQRYIYAFYHEAMLFPAYYWAGPEMQILISRHRDGDLIAGIVSRLGFGVVRGSTTRGGAAAMRALMHRVDRGHICITPDGPKGPRRHVQPGLAYMSSRTGLPIVGLGLAFRDPWRLQSWDRAAIPKPFCHAACVFPEPLLVSPNADRDEIEACRREVERRMRAATLEAETWVAQL